MEVKNKHSYIFSFKVILFLVLLAGIIHLMTDFVPIKRSKKLDYSLKHLEKTRDSVGYDVFYFSNSYLYTSVDPFYLKYLTGLNSLNFCVASQNTYFTIETIRSLLKSYQPACIILDLSKSSTMMPKDRKAWSFNIEGLLSSHITLPVLLNVIKIAPESEKQNVFFEGYTEFTATLKNLSDWKNYRKIVNYESVYGFCGFVPLSEQKEEIKNMKLADFNTKYYNHRRDQELFFDEINQLAFYKFLEEYRQKDMKIVFISSIKLNSASEGGFDSIATEIRALSPDNYFTINLNDTLVKKQLALTQDDFSDPIHVTHSGALKITEFIAPKISRIIGQDSSNPRHSKLTFSRIEICDYSIVLDDYFKKTVQLYLDSLPVNFKDSSLIIGVYPTDEKLRKLSEESKRKTLQVNMNYITRDDFIRTNQGTLVATVFLNTKLKKEQIDKVEISLKFPDVQEETITIYQSPKRVIAGKY